MGKESKEKKKMVCLRMLGDVSQFRHGHRIFIKHSSFSRILSLCFFLFFSQISYVSRMSVSRNHVTSLGDLELGGFAGLDSGLDS